MRIFKIIVIEILILLLAIAAFAVPITEKYSQIVFSVISDSSNLREITPVEKYIVILGIVPADQMAHYAPLPPKTTMICRPYDATAETGQKVLGLQCGSDKFYVKTLDFVEKRRLKKSSESNQDLNLAEEYKNFNELYFLNQLPKNTKVEWANLEDDLGQFFVTGTPGIARILIDRKGNPYPRYVRASLLHEMCHEKVDLLLNPEFDQHGHNWQSCMVDLAVHGAFHDIW